MSIAGLFGRLLAMPSAYAERNRETGFDYATPDGEEFDLIV